MQYFKDVKSNLQNFFPNEKENKNEQTTTHCFSLKFIIKMEEVQAEAIAKVGITNK